MHAVSLLGSLRQIEINGKRLLEMRTFSRTETESRLSKTFSTLMDIAELLWASTPFPLTQHGRRVEMAILELLRGRYRELSADATEFDEETIDIARREAEIEVGDSWLVIPLGESDARGKNWQPVFDFTRSRVGDIIDDFERITERIRTSADTRQLVETCEDIVEMLDVLEYTIGRITATKGYVTYRTEHSQGELLDAIEKKTTALRGDTDA